MAIGLVLSIIVAAVLPPSAAVRPEKVSLQEAVARSGLGEQEHPDGSPALADGSESAAFVEESLSETAEPLSEEIAEEEKMPGQMAQTVTAKRTLSNATGLKATVEGALLELSGKKDQTSNRRPLSPFAKGEYVGCFTDSRSRRVLPVYKGRLGSLDACRKACPGYTYVGLQNWAQCFCGMDYSKGSQRPDSECNQHCISDRTRMCGGTWRLSIYVIQTDYAGCFHGHGKRSLHFTKGSGFTVEGCREACHGYGLFGRNKHGLCRCGNGPDVGHPKLDAECTAGASGRVSVYRVEDDYVGCFDRGPFVYKQDRSSLRACRAACSGFDFFGLEGQSYCFCGERSNLGARKSEAECNTTCSEEKGRMCGGEKRSSVYRVDRGYKGCFQDDKTRSLPVHKGVRGSLGKCRAACSGYLYAGLQWYGHCFCGNDYSKGLQKAESECNTPCRDEKDRMCGGGWRNSIYLIEPNYVGCFTDSRNRVLPVSKGKPGSLQACRQACAGYTYLGLQHYAECFCGNDPKRFAPRPDSECNEPCGREPTRMCGGYFRLSVYLVETRSDVRALDGVTPLCQD